MGAPEIIKQHLIDPEICIRCNTCEDTCPIDAITHDDRNYVVRADVCNACNACLSPCPTGAIDNWRTMLKGQAYPIEEQLLWDELRPRCRYLQPNSMRPAPLKPFGPILPPRQTRRRDRAGRGNQPPHFVPRAVVGSSPLRQLHSMRAPLTATVAGNYRLTAEDASSDIHHIVLDFGTHFFPVLEGQAIGILPPGTDANCKPHYIRMYSIASPRDASGQATTTSR